MRLAHAARAGACLPGHLQVGWMSGVLSTGYTEYTPTDVTYSRCRCAGSYALGGTTQFKVRDGTSPLPGGAVPCRS